MKMTPLLPVLALCWLIACAPSTSSIGTGGTKGNGNTSIMAPGSTGSQTATGNSNTAATGGTASPDTPHTADPAAGSGNVTDGKFGNQPPESVTESFKKKYPEYTYGDWTMQEGQYTTTYMREGKSYRANFSNTGEWLDTQNDIVLDDLPATVKQAYQSSPYGAASNPRFSQIETAQYPVLYKAEGQLNNQPFSMYFTPEGRTVELPH